MELAPVLKQRFFDANGVPLSGGQVFTYAAGTTTPLATYTDQGGLTPNTNPVVLDSNGYGSIWLSASTYKFVVEDSLNNVIFTTDNVQSLSYQINQASNFSQVTIPYTQLQTGSLTNSITLFSLPALSLLKSIVIKHSTAFAGGSISALTAQVGISGQTQEFIENFDVFQTVADQAFDNTVCNYIGSFANPTNILLNAVAVGANLSSLTQGSLTVYYEYVTI